MKINDIKGPVEELDKSFGFAWDGEETDDDEGSYIEFALEPKPRWGETEHVLQFRLSFSTMVPRKSDSGGSSRRRILMPAESVISTGSDSYTYSTESYSSISSCSSSSSAVLGRSNAIRHPYGVILQNPENVKSSSEIRVVDKENTWRTAVQLLAAQRLVNLLMLNLRSSPENTVNERKQSKVRKLISSGLAKIFTKFRKIKAKSKSSLTRASNLISAPKHVNHNIARLSYSCYESPIEPFSGRERKKNKSRLPEVSINSIKGMIDSLTVSCPASVKSSPVHRNYCAAENKIYTRENSIQAAIAHCKMSLDQVAP